MSRIHNSREYDDNRHKIKRDEEHHKKDRNCERLIIKHNEKHNERHHDDEHHKRDHNCERLIIKHNENYYSKRGIFNSFKTNSAEKTNYVPLENHDTIVKEEFSKGTHSTIVKEEFSKETHTNQLDEFTIMNCKTTVTSEMLPLCENIPHTSEAIVEPVIAKIPVVITECTLTITTESSLKLEDNVLEIKHIRKNVYLTQCNLIPNSEDGKPNTGILFIDGFIRKNIEYTTNDHNDKGVSCGKVKHVTVRVPFKCTTRVTFKTHPKFKPNTPQDEVEILQTSIKVFDPCEEDITGRDTREQSFKIIEFFNEKVFCDLISAEIVESDILENSINKECKAPLEQSFHYITEKVVLSLTIKLLQNQYVEISKKD